MTLVPITNAMMAAGLAAPVHLGNSLRGGQGRELRPAPVDPTAFPNWDAHVLAHPACSFFHGTAWARTLQSAYHFRPVYFTSGAADGHACILPLMELDSWVTGRRGVCLPFTDHCEPLYSDWVCLDRVMQAVVDFGKSRGWNSVEWRGGRGVFGHAHPSLSFYQHTVELAPDDDRMFARLESSVQRAIRKAEKTGVSIRSSHSLEAMRAFYGLHCQTRRKHGLPPQPFAFFKSIFDHVVSQNLGFVAIASWRQRAIAAAIYFQMGARAVYKFGASDEAWQNLRGPNLVMWQAMKWLARQRATTLDLGRTSLENAGLRRFKLGWGAAEQTIDYFKYDLKKEQFVTEADQTTGWYNRVFRVLPLPLSRMIGSVLYRHCG